MSSEVYQGFLCDWDRLRDALLGEIDDLTCRGSVGTRAAFRSRCSDAGMMLAAIPVGLEIPLEVHPQAFASSPYRSTLALTWLAVLARAGRGRDHPSVEHLVRGEPQPIRVRGDPRAPHTPDDVPDVYGDARRGNGRRAGAETELPSDPRRGIGPPLGAGRERPFLRTARGGPARGAREDVAVDRLLAKLVPPSTSGRGGGDATGRRSTVPEGVEASPPTSMRSARSSSTSSTTPASTGRARSESTDPAGGVSGR